MQHHELPDATGFPRNLGHLRISPLACVFIIAEDFALSMMENKSKEKVAKLVAAEFTIKYNKGNFKHALEEILKLINS